MNRTITLLITALTLVGHGSAMAAGKPLKVYILAGQSNMEGHAKIETFDYIGDDPATALMLKEMRGPDGEPRVCQNVWISYLTGSPDRGMLGEGVGRLTAGYGARSTPKEDGGKIGPEFTFGIYASKAYDGPILLIKTAWGGKDLYCDFRPPSAGPPAYEIKPKWNKEREIGLYDRLMVEHVRNVLADPKRIVPDYDAKAGYEIAGFVWFQGWNDMVAGDIYPDRHKPGGYAEYSRLMACFVRDVRKELAAPKMPFVIGVIGVHGDKAEGPIANLRPAMAAPADMNEFKGNVAAVYTGQFWDYEMAAMEPKLPDLDRLKDSAYVITDGGTMEKREPGTPDWQPVGRPAPEERVWRYTTFDPQHENSAEYIRKRMDTMFTPREQKLLNGASNAAYHYMGSGKMMAQIGKAFAEANLELEKK